MVNLFKKIRIAAFWIGFAYILFAILWFFTDLISTLSREPLSFSLDPENLTPLLYSVLYPPMSFSQALSLLITFASRLCGSLTLIILACLMDPVKVVPFFRKKAVTKAVPESVEDNSTQEN